MKRKQSDFNLMKRNPVYNFSYPSFRFTWIYKQKESILSIMMM